MLDHGCDFWWSDVPECRRMEVSAGAQEEESLFSH
jgi:hypothetical protein